MSPTLLFQIDNNYLKVCENGFWSYFCNRSKKFELKKYSNEKSTCFNTMYYWH